MVSGVFYVAERFSRTDRDWSFKKNVSCADVRPWRPHPYGPAPRNIENRPSDWTEGAFDVRQCRIDSCPCPQRHTGLGNLLDYASMRCTQRFSSVRTYVDQTASLLIVGVIMSFSDMNVYAFFVKPLPGRFSAHDIYRIFVHDNAVIGQGPFDTDLAGIRVLLDPFNGTLKRVSITVAARAQSDDPVTLQEGKPSYFTGNIRHMQFFIVTMHRDGVQCAPVPADMPGRGSIASEVRIEMFPVGEVTSNTLLMPSPPRRYPGPPLST